MKTVTQIAAEIVAREGGYVNDPDDPGGATKFGVTLATLQRLGIDKTGDGRVDVADVRALTRADAEALGVQVAEALLDQGAEQILQAVYGEAGHA